MTTGRSLGDAVRSHTHVHVFNIHLCLLLQLNNHLFVKLLELSQERKKKYKQNKTKIKFIAHYSSGNTQLSHMVSFDKEGVMLGCLIMDF